MSRRDPTDQFPKIFGYKNIGERIQEFSEGGARRERMDEVLDAYQAFPFGQRIGLETLKA